MTPESAEACGRIVDAGIPMGNQSVLLKGINDDPRLLETLFRGLVRNRVRPYYLYQCDLVRGVEHFRTPISRGIEIMEYLRGRLTGLRSRPMSSTPLAAAGKIPLLPNYIVSSSPTHTVLRNFEGMLVSYPEPGQGVAPNLQMAGGNAPTIHDLARGEALKIEPNGSGRMLRREKMQEKAHGLIPLEALVNTGHAPHRAVALEIERAPGQTMNTRIYRLHSSAFQEEVVRQVQEIFRENFSAVADYAGKIPELAGRSIQLRLPDNPARGGAAAEACRRLRHCDLLPRSQGLLPGLHGRRQVDSRRRPGQRSL